jgi:general secretion pathway protein L
VASSTFALSLGHLRQNLADWARGAADWWITELSASLPESAANWLTDAGVRALLVIPEGNAVRLLLRDQSGQALATAPVAPGEDLTTAITAVLDKFGLDRRNVPFGLRLPKEKFFVREFALPREVGRSVQTVALHDLLKKTPLREEEIYHTLATQNMGRRLHVTQTVVRRKFIEEGAANLGLDLQDFAFVEMPMKEKGGSGASAIHLKDGREESRWFSELFRGLAAMLIALAAAAVAVQYREQQARLDELAERLVLVRAQAQAVRTELDAANLQASTLNQLRSRKLNAMRFLQLWEELSRRLPSDSWVSEVRVSKAEKNTLKVTLTGFSSAAANLVEVVDQSPLFHTVALTAPIAIDPVEQRERFVLQASVDDGIAEKSLR